MLQPSENAKPNQEQIENVVMKWQNLHPTGPTDDQRSIDTIAANMWLGPFARPEGLFNASYGKATWLNRNDFSALTPSRENHLYLAQITRTLLDNSEPDLVGIRKLFGLISDFDILPIKRVETKPYADKYDGVTKFFHPDFNELRESIKRYLSVLKSNHEFQKNVQNEINKRGGNTDEILRFLIGTANATYDW